MSLDALLPALLLAQEAPPVSNATAALLPLIYVLAFLGVFTFVVTGFLLFNTGWESYEEKYVDGAERTLDDLFLTIPPQQMMWLQVLGGFGGFTLAFVTTDSLATGGVLGILGVLAPRITLVLLRRKRAKAFLEQLTDALVTVTNALRTGFSLPKAFQLIATDMPKPICQEFGILVQELRLGIEVEEGLENMLDRMPSDDLDLVVTSVAISNEVGGNLAEVFDRIAYTIRERNRIEGRIKSLTAQGRMQGILVSLLPMFVGFMLWVIDPHMMSVMWETTIGIAVLVAMVIMECLGYFFIHKITNIEV